MYTPRDYFRLWREVAGNAESGADIQMEREREMDRREMGGDATGQG